MENEPKEQPVCPHGHTDEIIPCKYGILSQDEYAEIQKNESAHVMGCMKTFSRAVTTFDEDGRHEVKLTVTSPKWYCKIHKITF